MSKKNVISKICLPSTFHSEGVNVYLIEGEILTLVDTGQNLEGSWDMFRDQLKSIGYRVKDIEQIILTHHHVDHIGLIKYFDDDVRLLGHSNCERWLNPTTTFLEQHDLFFEELFDQLFVPDYLAKPYLSFKHKHIVLNAQRGLDYHLNGGEEVPGLSEWRVEETFGHSQCHISLFRPEDGMLIGGDVLINNVTSNPIIEPPKYRGEERPKSQIQYNATLRRLLELPIQQVQAGHGENIMNPRELIYFRLDKQHKRAMQVKDWLSCETMNAFDVCRCLFPNSYESRIGLTMFETLGQLDYLLSHQYINEEQIKLVSKHLVIP